jgi:phage internal scaffolding protein
VNKIRAHAKNVKRVTIDTGPGLTEQHHKDKCDVNQILAKYQKTGVIEHVKRHGAHYGFCDGRDFTEATFLVTKAREMFEDLPSKTREKFAHDPAKFLDFVDSLPDGPERATLLFEAGLAAKPQEGQKALTEAPTASESNQKSSTGEDG